MTYLRGYDDVGEWPSVEEVEIEPEDELKCDHCGKPADEDDLWQGGNPIKCNSYKCILRRLEAYNAEWDARIKALQVSLEDCPF